MNDEQQFYYALGFCTVILVLATLYKLFPPKDIHSLYGYKSKRALKTIETWKEANRFAGVALFKISFIGFVFPFLFYFFIPQYNLFLTIITSTLLLFFIVFLTEKYLDTYFTKDGTGK
jgi:uncharacterized membrane protein